MLSWLSSDPLTGAAERSALALAGGLGLVVYAERRHIRSLGNRVLFLRWRTWLVTAPLYGLAVAWSRWGALAFVVGCTIQSIREYAQLLGLPRRYRVALLAAGCLAGPVAVVSSVAWLALPGVVLVAATLLPIVGQDVDNGVGQLAGASFGFVYVGWSLSSLVVLRERVAGGVGALLVLGAVVAASDVAAFVVGKRIGRHQLASRLSPAKTWEGVAGNVAGAYVAFVGMRFALPAGLDPIVVWTLPLVISIGCLWGDLIESLLKRRAGVKDAGAWLPGFGGLLDRLDSFLVALPLTCLVLVLAT
jgi:phosphatidate cytidylyltransferase